MPNLVFDNFNGGIPEDTWGADKNFFTKAVHLDNFNQPARLRPYRSWSEVTGGNEIENMHSASDGDLYGLGATGTGEARVYSLTTGNWTQPTNNEASSGSVRYEMFFEHQGYLYMWDGAKSIGRFKLDATGFTTNWFTIPASVTNSTGGTIALPSFEEGMGYRFPLNDQAYFAYANVLFGINNSTDTPEVLFILPQEYRITSISYWQNFMAIGCEHVERYDDSKVYFWDTVSADASFVEEVPEGQLKILKNVGGQLVAITRFGASNVIRGTSIIASTYSGSEFLQRRRVTLSNDTEGLQIREASSTVKNNQLYFGVEFDTTASMYRFGINGNEYCMTEDRYVDNTNTAGSAFALETVGDTFYVNIDSTTNRSNFSKDYTMTAKPFYETVRIPAGKNGEKAKLEYIAVHTVPTVDEDNFTPATQTVEVKYRADNEASYTSLGTHDASTQDYTKLNDNGGAVNFPDDWKSIVFQLEVTGLAQLHRFEVGWSTIPSNVG